MPTSPQTISAPPSSLKSDDGMERMRTDVLLAPSQRNRGTAERQEGMRRCEAVIQIAPGALKLCVLGTEQHRWQLWKGRPNEADGFRISAERRPVWAVSTELLDPANRKPLSRCDTSRTTPEV